jgi:hypothetical protein
MGKVIVYLTSVSLASHGPRVDHPGARGVGYPYSWDTKHQKFILYGKELSAEELAKVAPDIFGAEKSHRVPTPMLVPTDPTDAPVTAPQAATVDALFGAASAMPVADQRKLGFKLVNATRPSRKNTKKA